MSIFKGENKQPEFLAMNPLGKLPFLREGDFRLPESAAILRYLATTHKACPVSTTLVGASAAALYAGGPCLQISLSAHFGSLLTQGLAGASWLQES